MNSRMGEWVQGANRIGATGFLLVLTVASVSTRMGTLRLTYSELPRIKTQTQLGHARELRRMNATKNEAFPGPLIDLRGFVLKTVQERLPGQFRDRAFEIARAVITEANHHGLDPMFLLAVISTESHFNLKARGTHGEVGLMQILPRTAAWLAPQVGLSPDFNLEDPAVNIRIGATYFAQLRRQFQGKPVRYVGAYNMGPANVRRLLASNAEPEEYPSRVMGNYRRFYQNLSRGQDRHLAMTSVGRSHREPASHRHTVIID